MLDELVALTALWRESIRRGEAPTNDVETRMDVSARHVATAAFGAQLEPAWQAYDKQLAAIFPGLGHATAVTAAQSLVFGNAMTALDMCASAAATWCSAPPIGEDREHDLGSLISRKSGAPTVRQPQWSPAWLTAWATALANDPRFGALWSFRDRQTHRVVRRSTSVTPRTVTPSLTVPTLRLGSAAAPSSNGSPEPSTAAPASRETFGPYAAADEPAVAATYDECVSLTRERWESFWTALASSPRQG